MALDRTTQPIKAGFISDVAVTGGDMLRGGAKTGMKSFGYAFLGGIALVALGGVAVAMAGALSVVGGFGILGGLIGLGLAGSSLSIAGIGFGLGALLGPSEARDRRVATGQEVAPSASKDIQAQLAQQKAYNRQLQGTYGALSTANAPTAQQQALPVQQAQAQPTGYNPQLKGMYNQIASDVAANGQALHAPAAGMIPADHGAFANEKPNHTHVARMHEQRSHSQASAADPTAQR